MESRKRIHSLMMITLKVYILLMVFIIPERFSGYVIWGTEILIILLYIIDKFLGSKSDGHQFAVPIRSFFLWTFLLGSIVIILICSEYPSGKTIQTTLMLLIVSLTVKGDYLRDIYERKFDWFYWAFTVFLVISIYINYRNNLYLSFANFADQNYASVIVFLYALYSFNGKRFVGIVISLIYALLTPTRLYYIVIVIAFLIWTIQYRRQKKGVLKDVEYNYSKLVFMFFMLFVGSILLSIVWSNLVVGTSTVSYKQGWNDTSNAMRMNANLYAIRLFKSDPKLLIRGYDSQIREVLGIGDYWLERHATYLGMRLIQPHNSYINPLITHGALFTCAYYLLISDLMDGIITYKNRYVWIPYFIAGIFMHSLFSSFYLVFFVIDINIYNNYIPEENRRIKWKEF